MKNSKYEEAFVLTLVEIVLYVDDKWYCKSICLNEIWVRKNETGDAKNILSIMSSSYTYYLGGA